jgi:hypothetical protein
MSPEASIDFLCPPPPGYVLQSEDAVYAVEAMQFEHWRAMSPREKVALLDGHSRFLRELSLAGIRSRNPAASEAEIERLAAELWLGTELYQRLVAPRLST